MWLIFISISVYCLLTVELSKVIKAITAFQWDQSSSFPSVPDWTPFAKAPYRGQ